MRYLAEYEGAREHIADVLSRAYDGKPLAELRDEHAAHHRQAAEELLAAGLADAIEHDGSRLTRWDVPSKFDAIDELRRMADEAGKDTPAGGESTQPAERLSYRAAYEHDITPLETYTNWAAAREHCEDEALAGLSRDERELRWETDPDEPEIEELHVDGQATGYTVTTVTEPSAYDPEAGR